MQYSQLSVQSKQKCRRHVIAWSLDDQKTFLVNVQGSPKNCYSVKSVWNTDLLNKTMFSVVNINYVVIFLVNHDLKQDIYLIRFLFSEILGHPVWFFENCTTHQKWPITHKNLIPVSIQFGSQKEYAEECFSLLI